MNEQVFCSIKILFSFGLRVCEEYNMTGIDEVSVQKNELKRLGYFITIPKHCGTMKNMEIKNYCLYRRALISLSVN